MLVSDYAPQFPEIAGIADTAALCPVNSLDGFGAQSNSTFPTWSHETCLQHPNRFFCEQMYPDICRSKGKYWHNSANWGTKCFDRQMTESDICTLAWGRYGGTFDPKSGACVASPGYAPEQSLCQFYGGSFSNGRCTPGVRGSQLPSCPSGVTGTAVPPDDYTQTRLIDGSPGYPYCNDVVGQKKCESIGGDWDGKHCFNVPLQYLLSNPDGSPGNSYSQNWPGWTGSPSGGTTPPPPNPPSPPPPQPGTPCPQTALKCPNGYVAYYGVQPNCTSKCVPVQTTKPGPKPTPSPKPKPGTKPPPVHFIPKPAQYHWYYPGQALPNTSGSYGWNQGYSTGRPSSGYGYGFRGLGFDPSSMFTSALGPIMDYFKGREQNKVAKKEIAFQQQQLKAVKEEEARQFAIDQADSFVSDSAKKRQEEEVALYAVGAGALVIASLFILGAMKDK